jgi:hypothetical protein
VPWAALKRLTSGRFNIGHREDRTRTHRYAESCETAMAAFAKSWRRNRPANALIDVNNRSAQQRRRAKLQALTAALPTSHTKRYLRALG